MAAVSPCEVLCDALALYESGEYEWHRGSRSSRGGKPAVCLWHCAEDALRRRKLGQAERELLSGLVAMHLVAAITPGATSDDIGRIMAFNDAKERTKAEALEVLRKAGTCPSQSAS